MRLSAWLAACVAMTLLSPDAAGGHRFRRQFGWTTGAPFANVYRVASDPAGYIWIGSYEGYFRYDGTEFKHVLADKYAVYTVKSCLALGRHIVTSSGPPPTGQQLIELTGGNVRPISVPHGAELFPLEDATCSGTGELWVVRQGRVYREQREQGWRQVVGLDPLDPVRQVFPGRGHGVLIATTDRLREVRDDSSVHELLALRGVIQVAYEDDGSLLALTWRLDGGHLHRVGHGSNRELFFRPTRPLSLAVHDQIIWVGFDNALIAIWPDGTTEQIEADTAIVGADLAFDSEGMLWVAGGDRVSQLPQPRSHCIEGPTPYATRWITPHGDALLVSGRGGTRILPSRTTSRRLEPFPLWSLGAICIDPAGRVWGGRFDGFTVRDLGGTVRTSLGKAFGDLAPCAIDRQGTVWFPTTAGLFRLPRGADIPEPVPSFTRPTLSAMVDSSGWLWVGGEDGAVCSQDPLSSSNDRWNCQHLSIREPVQDLFETRRGQILAVAQGLHLRVGERWQSIASRDPTVDLRRTRRLAPSPRGGAWALGDGLVARIEESFEQGQAVVLERIGAWHGLPHSTGFDLFEEASGKLWVSGGDTLMNIPPEARDLPGAPKRVAITSLRADNVDLPADQEFQLPYRTNRLEVRASAFSYRDPTRCSYRYRLRSEDEWSAPVLDPTFRFYDLAPGRYSLSIAASLSGTDWMATTTPISFRVLRPWYLHPVFFASLALIAALAGWWLHHVRVARLLALERQRARIAMDLHDAIGSGLGSIGLLAGVGALASSAPQQRQVLSEQIAKMAADLGMSLAEIVWSLRPGSDRLDNLASYLKERGNLLFDTTQVQLVTEYPEHWPELSLALPVQRHLMSIALEALGNAARHAQPRRVALGLRKLEQHRWELYVDDDGLGMAAGINPGTGHGLDNMRRRSQEIGAALRIEVGRSGGGSCVTLEFDPEFRGA